jgi:hypothetical protein
MSTRFFLLFAITWHSSVLCAQNVFRPVIPKVWNEAHTARPRPSRHQQRGRIVAIPGHAEWRQPTRFTLRHCGGAFRRP